MNGLIRNTASLFSNDGKLFVMAMDRGMVGVVPGLEDVAAKMYGTANSELDGYLVNLGPARHMADERLVNKSCCCALPSAALLSAATIPTDTLILSLPRTFSQWAQTQL